jgi:hypothetical protein
MGSKSPITSILWYHQKVCTSKTPPFSNDLPEAGADVFQPVAKLSVQKAFVI